MALDSTKVFAQHLAKVNIIRNVVSGATSTSNGIVTLIDTLQATYEGDRVSVSENWVSNYRSVVSGLIQNAADMLQGTWADFMQVINISDSGVEPIRYRETYDWMTANSVYFLSRSPTVTAATSAKGVLKTCSVDYDNFTIENVSDGTFAMECMGGQNFGDVPGRERWRVRPTNPGIDWIDFYDSPRAAQGELNTWDSERNSLLTNPSFGSWADAGAAATATIGSVNTVIGGWSVLTGTITDLYVTRDLYFNHDSRSGTAYSYGNCAVIGTNASTSGSSAGISFGQTISNNLRTDVPYVRNIKWYRNGNAFGTIGLSVGSVSATADLSTATPSTWVTLEIPNDSTAWSENFIPTTQGWVQFNIGFTAATSHAGELLIDHCVFHEFDRFANQFLSLEQGTADFVMGDTIGWTVGYNTTGTVGNRQKAEAVLNNRYYPSTTASSAALTDA